MERGEKMAAGYPALECVMVGGVSDGRTGAYEMEVGWRVTMPSRPLW